MTSTSQLKTKYGYHGEFIEFKARPKKDGTLFRYPKHGIMGTNSDAIKKRKRQVFDEKMTKLYHQAMT